MGFCKATEHGKQIRCPKCRSIQLIEAGLSGEEWMGMSTADRRKYLDGIMSASEHEVPEMFNLQEQIIEPEPVYVPEPEPAYIPEPSYEPEPVYVSEPEPVYVPEPAIPEFGAEPEEAPVETPIVKKKVVKKAVRKVVKKPAATVVPETPYVSEEPAYIPEPEPVYVPEPEPAYIPGSSYEPEPVYVPEPQITIPAYEAVTQPEQEYAPEPAMPVFSSEPEYTSAETPVIKKKVVRKVVKKPAAEEPVPEETPSEKKKVVKKAVKKVVKKPVAAVMPEMPYVPEEPVYVPEPEPAYVPETVMPEFGAETEEAPVETPIVKKKVVKKAVKKVVKKPAATVEPEMPYVPEEPAYVPEPEPEYVPEPEVKPVRKKKVVRKVVKKPAEDVLIPEPQITIPAYEAVTQPEQEYAPEPAIPAFSTEPEYTPAETPVIKKKVVRKVVKKPAAEEPVPEGTPSEKKKVVRKVVKKPAVPAEAGEPAAEASYTEPSYEEHAVESEAGSAAVSAESSKRDTIREDIFKDDAAAAVAAVVSDEDEEAEETGPAVKKKKVKEEVTPLARRNRIIVFGTSIGLVATLMVTTLVVPSFRFRDEMARLRNAQVGDIIPYGKYKGNTGWIVLDKKPDRVLCISNYEVGNASTDDIVWESSPVREELNSTFMNSTFNMYERIKVLSSEKIREEEPDYATAYVTRELNDKMFILKDYELKDYIADNSEIMVQLSDTAVHPTMWVNIE